MPSDIFVIVTAPLFAQSASPTSVQVAPPMAKRLSLAGPRYGFTFLSDGIVSKLGKEDIQVKNAVSQFGWQFEHQFYNAGGDGPTVLTRVTGIGNDMALDEGVGICGKGEAKDFIADGHLGPKGRMPCNTNGGLIGEGYIHGLNLVLEATRQLRGTAVNQIPDARTVLVTASRTGARWMS